MSTIAVFIALGGTSYAVARNSIGSAQLKKNAVTSSKVKNGSLQSGDLAPSARIGQRGPRGPEGPPGANGAAGGAAVDLAPEAWQPLSLVGGWANHSTVYGSTYEDASFRKDKQGEVHLRGLVVQNAGLPSASPILAVLPVGYRPARRQLFTGFAGAPSGATRIDISPDGAVTWVDGPNAENDYTSLAQIEFFPG
jgi:hypothetical protein